MRSAILAVSLVALVSAAVATHAEPKIFEKPLSPRIVTYKIDARLEADKRLIHGKETLTWRNTSAVSVGELQFHLYLNAFRNTKSTMAGEAKGFVFRGIDIDENEFFGGIEVTRIDLSTGEELTTSMQFIHPDNDDKDDKTVFRLPLPAPVLPGRTVTVDIDFTARLPSPPIRTGSKKEYFFAGQWFPKIGVHIDGRWNCHQFHANSEFFADFGVYDVRITVPKENIVGATGLEVEVVKNSDGTATHYYHAEDVHDFAWTTSPEFIEIKDRVQDVEIRLLMQPDHMNQADRHLTAAKAAISFLQGWIGDYPFPNVTIVDPRRGAMGSGGMEYPTLITVGTSYGIPKGIRISETTLVHEFSHNYWYHLVASNEFEEPWLDEGFTNYSEIKIMDETYGPGADSVDFMGIEVDDWQLARIRYAAAPDLDPMVRYSWQYYSRTSYGNNAYSKPALMLLTLENYLGGETMQKVLRAYFQKWIFKHPKTGDFIETANSVSGRNLNWFFDQAFFTNEVLDYSVDKISTKKVEKGRGYDFTLVPFSSEPSKDKDKDKEEETEIYESEVSVRRLGGFVFPVEVEMKFDNGETVREKWDGKDTWKRFSYIKKTKLVSAEIDPDNKVLLDIDLTNNSKTVEKEGNGLKRLSLWALFSSQFLFEQPEAANLLTFIGNMF
jgi:hypothetical protein